MSDVCRWGILGPGNIARKFADCLSAVPGAVLQAVGSRDQAKAATFAEPFAAVSPAGGATAYGSYEALVADPQVDAIYVATPHPMHPGHVKLALEAGKAVLCEKPFCVNAAQAREVVALARAKGLFAMEAMWTRFLPVSVKVREWIAAGAIGEPRLATADFGFRAGVNPEGRLFNPALAGGGLLDVGVYVIAYANMVFGGPASQAVGLGTLGETGVDEQCGCILSYPGGGLGVLSSAVRVNTPQGARIDGTEGRIEVPSFWNGSQATLTAGGKTETVELPHAKNGFEYEVREAQRCLAAGLTESPEMTLDETVAIAETMDELRRQMGVKYPME